MISHDSIALMLCCKKPERAADRCPLQLVVAEFTGVALGGLRPCVDLRQRDVILPRVRRRQCCCSATDCCAAFGRAGLGVVLDKTHWNSSTDLKGEAVHVLGQDTKRERHLEFIGSVIESSAHGGGAVQHRARNATSKSPGDPLYLLWPPGAAILALSWFVTCFSLRLHCVVLWLA